MNMNTGKSNKNKRINMKKKKQIATVYSQKKLTEDIYDLWVTTDLGKDVVAGQFLSIYPKNQSTLLPRPISVCEADRTQGRIRFVYRVVGEGTKEFSSYQAGDAISIMGNLGNGFLIEEAKGKCVVLLGGGVGIPPMLQLAKDIKNADATTEIHIILGYRDSTTFLDQEISAFGTVHIATDDGSLGTKGNVVTVLQEKKIPAEIIYSCGPTPMLRAIKHFAAEKGIKAYLSLEERMACGVGACLGCVCETKGIDEHSKVNNTRVCADGPVFEAQEVEI